jgi:hypothetical protein
MKHPGKFRTHWIRPFEVAYVTKGGFAQLNMLNGEWRDGLVNGSWFKLYCDNQLSQALSKSKGRRV